MSYLCGCSYYVTSRQFLRIQKYLPLLDSTVHSTILSTTSRTVLKQKFTNPSSTEAIKECTYTFPLYDGVSVVSFTCRIGKKVLRGLVKEKVKAKQIFDDAVSKGQTAGLLEQAPEASDVFSTKLGNIPAGQSVIVEVTYIGELKHHEIDGIRFTIPTKIAPRYGSGPTHGSMIQDQDEGSIKITVDVNMLEGSFIKAVQSPSHPIAVSMGVVSTASTADPLMSKASATLSLGSIALEKDFVLIVQSKDIGIPKAILETHPTIRHHRALMATLVPKFSLPSSRPEIVFVADRSGSMRNNMEMLISAMKVFLKSLPVGVKFNICSFGTHCSFLWEKSQSYTQETLQQASNHLLHFRADFGGTEMFGAIKATIERRFTDIPLEIMLLTDGDIWSQDHLFKYVNQQVEETKGNIRIFPLGIGNGVSHTLIEGLARAGNGFGQAVQNGERLDNCVVRMLRGALSPHITDYTLEVKYEKENDDFELIDKVTEGMKVLLSDDEIAKAEEKKDKPTISLFDSNANPEKEDLKGLQDSVFWLPKIHFPKLHQAPHKIPTLFAFSRISVYLLMSPETIQRNPTAVILRATSTHGPLALEIPIESLATPAETIHQLAAKKAVQDLEEGRGWIYDAKDQNGILVKDRYPSCFDDLVQREAVRLGEKFQIAGKWCSFVAVAANDKEIAEKENKDIEQKSLVIDDDGDIYGASDDDLQLVTPGSGDDDGFEMIYGSSAPAPTYQPTKRSVVSRRGAKCRATPKKTFRCSSDTDEDSSRTRAQARISQTSLSNASEQPVQLPSVRSSSPEASSAFSFGSLELGNKLTFGLFGSPPQPVKPQPKFAIASPMASFGSSSSNEKVLLPQNQPFGRSAFGAQSTGSGLFSTSAQNMSAGQRGGRGGYRSSVLNRPQATRYDSSQAPQLTPYSGPLEDTFTSVSGSTQAPPSIGYGPSLFGGIMAGAGGQGTPGGSPTPASAEPDPQALFGQTQHYQANLAQQQAASVFNNALPPPPPMPESYTMHYSMASVSPPGSPARKKKMKSTRRSEPEEGVQDELSMPSPIDWSSKSISEKVLALITLQVFEGSWPDDDDEVLNIMGIGRDVRDGKVGVDRKVWITLLVVKWMEIRAPAEEGTWGLVVEKARGWLEGCGGTEVEGWEADAGIVVEGLRKE